MRPLGKMLRKDFAASVFRAGAIALQVSRSSEDRHLCDPPFLLPGWPSDLLQNLFPVRFLSREIIPCSPLYVLYWIKP